MRAILFLLSLLFAVLPETAGAQQNYATGNFLLPLDVRPVLSGTFGELRSNHFHSGIDIKTQGTVGKPVYAIEDGFVSRIKVSPSGFGNTLYINHEDGYTSVYAHLQDFRKDLAEFVKSEQYRRENFDVDLYLEEDRFMVSRGEIIARSGNSGYSFGPHLHFEIREASTQKPINPMLFGFEIKDEISPKIKKLRLYPESPETLINGQPHALTATVAGYGARHYLESIDTVYAYGDLSLGLVTYDLLNGAANKNGIYEIRIWHDDTLFYHLRLEKFAFSETRYINSLIDYPEYIASKERYIRSKLDPNNRLNIYEKILNDGIISVIDSSVHRVKLDVVDVYGNTATLSFLIKGTGEDNEHIQDMPTGDVQLVSWRDESSFEAEGIRVFFPAYAFYDNIAFSYKVTAATVQTYSPLHQVGNSNIPVHKYLTLSIKPIDLDPELNDKALLALLNGENGQAMSAAGGMYDDGMVTGKIREFGTYAVTIDTIAPLIEPLNVRNAQHISTGQKLQFKIKDEFSGIRSYRGTMNNEWVLMQYDAKNDLLYYIVDEHTKKGKNEFLLQVSDQKDNTSSYEAELILK